MAKLDEEIRVRELESPPNQPKWQIWILLDADVALWSIPIMHPADCQLYNMSLALLKLTRMYLYIYIEYITYIDNALEVI